MKGIKVIDVGRNPKETQFGTCELCFSYGIADNPYMVIKNQVLDIVSKIDEPQKVTVPKFVAEWLEWCKANDVTLLGGISPIDELGSTICSEKRVKSRDATRWAKQNQETFARAWLDGYEIEKEKLYTVEIPNQTEVDTVKFILLKIRMAK